MSAIAVYAADNGIVFAADGAVYDNQGFILGFAHKLYSSPHQDCVFGHVGIGGFGECIVQEIGTTPRFDDLVDRLIEYAKRAYEQAIKDWPEEWQKPRATMIIGGWSARRQAFELYKLHSSPKPIVDLETGEEDMSEPWQLIPVAGIWASSMPLAKDCETFGIDWDGELDAIDTPARIVCALRAGSIDRGDAVYGVGGFLQMMVLTASGVKSWIAHEWPDPIGEPIDPLRGHPMPSFPLEVPE